MQPSKRDYEVRIHKKERCEPWRRISRGILCRVIWRGIRPKETHRGPQKDAAARSCNSARSDDSVKSPAVTRYLAFVWPIPARNGFKPGGGSGRAPKEWLYGKAPSLPRRLVFRVSPVREPQNRNKAAGISYPQPVPIRNAPNQVLRGRPRLPRVLGAGCSSSSSGSTSKADSEEITVRSSGPSRSRSSESTSFISGGRDH